MTAVAACTATRGRFPPPALTTHIHDTHGRWHGTHCRSVAWPRHWSAARMRSQPHACGSAALSLPGQLYIQVGTRGESLRCPGNVTLYSRQTFEPFYNSITNVGIHMNLTADSVSGIDRPTHALLLGIHSIIIGLFEIIGLYFVPTLL